MTMQQAGVAVIGAGIAGLRAARLLQDAGVRVVVHEASSRIGGQIRTVDVGGVPVDVGAEAMHLGAPGAAELIESLGLAPDMVTARPGASWIVTPKGLRRLPAGVGPAGPTRLRPVLASGVMTVPGLARAGLEPLLARTRGRTDLSAGRDRSVGDFVGGRFGDQVVERFVDPLLGSLHAGDVRTLSLRACTPSLVTAAEQGRSLVTGRKKARGPARPGAKPPAMSFVTWREGLTRVVQTLAAGLDIRTNSPVERIERTDDGRYRLRLGGSDAAAAGDADERTFDAVVVALPGDRAAALLDGLAPRAPGLLGQTPRANVATLVLAYPRHVVEALPAFAGTGILVPSSVGSLLKAATFLSTKWPHLDHPDLYFCRASAGRAGDERLAGLDDDALVARVRADLARFIGLQADPRHVHVQRWPAALPQLTVGHLDRLTSARDDLPAGLALAGSSYDGVGIAACLGSARRAATDVLTHLGPTHAQGGTRA